MRGKAHGAQRLAAQEAKGHSVLICKGTEEPSDRQFRLKRRMSEYPDKKREVDTVSNRELAKELIDGFTDAQLYTVIGMLYAEKKRLEEADDDAFCLKLAQEYEHLPEEEKGDFLPFAVSYTHLAGRSRAA